MAYKRNWRYNPSYYNSNRKTKVTIHWDNNACAYKIQFHGTHTWKGRWYYGAGDEGKKRWTQIKDVLIAYIMKIPYGERDSKCIITTPDLNKPEEKLETYIYYLVEKNKDGSVNYIQNLIQLIEMMPNDFEIDFIEKPVGEPVSQFVPTEVYLDRFKEITGENITGSDFSTARSIYRRNCFKLHPDRNPGNNEVAMQMSSLNEIWYHLEIEHFKTKQLVQQEQ